MSKKALIVLVLVVLGIIPVIATTFGDNDSERAPLVDHLAPPDSVEQKYGKWAKSVLDTLSLDEKIGQLFMVAAYSNKDAKHVAAIEKLVKEEKIGGLIFMQGGPGRQVNLANRYQKAADVPLLIAQDSEWGLGMRLDSTISFPRNMTLGAIRDNKIIHEIGMEIGRQCRQVGVQVNFAPVVDVNNNPNNPVINDRSFGENPQNVAQKGLYFYKGMEYSNCVGTAKHFPGHGDTDTDSHKDLPIIGFDRARLDTVELYPFRYLFKNGVAGVMVAHLYIPALDTTENLASTLSRKIVTDLLKDELGFKGLIFTDALGMQGVTKFWEDGETDLKAFEAGNDVLLFSKMVPKAKKLIKQAIQAGVVSEKELDRRVLKILVTKEWTGLHRQKVLPSPDMATLNAPEAEVLKKKSYQAAMTLVKNEGDLVPLRKLDARKIAVVEIGSPNPTPFFKTLEKYTAMDRFTLSTAATTTQREALLKKLQPYNTVIVGIDKMSKRASKNWGITNSTKAFLRTADAAQFDLVVTLFGSPYSLKNFGAHEDAILVAYENKGPAKVAAAEALMGAIHVDGILPVTASAQFPEGTSIVRMPLPRFEFTLPEAAGMDGQILRQGLDSIAQAAIKMGATPGMSVLVMRHNQIVHAQGYGKTEYGKTGKQVDAANTVYDLASVTKIMSTTLATMKLVSEGQIDLNEQVSAYLADFRGRNLTHIRVKNLLQHNAGFRSWIPFYRDTYDSTGALRKDLYAENRNDTFCVKIVDDLWMCTDYQDSIWVKIVNSKIRDDGKVRYSDLSMMVMQRVIEAVTGTTLDNYVDSVFYAPMGMNRTAYNPHDKLESVVFPPTENDTYWRKKKVEGYVHDQAAAMLGGVSGHAGLFSNVYDVAKAMLMVKNGGRYGEMTYFDEEIVKKFTSRQLKSSRKGLGWDKHDTNPDRSTPCTRYASELTYGHTGFTGIGVWVDPKYDLVFVFLSNRTFPDSNNKKLQRENIRPLMQQKAYEAILKYEKRNSGDKGGETASK